VTAAQVETAVGELVAAGRLVRDGTVAVYLREAHEAECGLGRRVRELLAAGREATAGPTEPAERPEIAAAVAASAATAGVEYSQEQRQAIATALASPVAVVTGGPGTGKSTVVRGVLAALRHLRPEAVVHLAAPTGRAAKRMEELAGEPAKTVHRLLEYAVASRSGGPPGRSFPAGNAASAGAFQRGADDPLAGDLLVVDEASMLDLHLAHALFQAVPAGMQVLLVGDADQLPSVGFGNVFADFIRSGAVPVVRLSQIFRQALQSRIVVNAHRVNQGEMPLLEPASDWEFAAIDDPAEVAEYIRRAALEHRAAGRSLAEFNVLTPMRKTETGAAALNRLLQQALNPPAAGRREVRSGDSVLRVGDKVMQIRNNYGKEVYNGDVGILTAIREPEESAHDEDTEDTEGTEDDERRVVVAYPGQQVDYGSEELDQIALAYAATVHKAQGSEYSGVVVVPVVQQHWVMLQRNLLYTAITRARDRVVLVGQQAAIRRAVTNAGSRRRYSHLAHRLREE
jgi:exodeoxyribonuclease V alpha subunit